MCRCGSSDLKAYSELAALFTKLSSCNNIICDIIYRIFKGLIVWVIKGELHSWLFKRMSQGMEPESLPDALYFFLQLVLLWNFWQLKFTFFQWYMNLSVQIISHTPWSILVTEYKIWIKINSIKTRHEYAIEHN